MAAFEEWSDDLHAALAEPFARDDHKTKRQGGSEITFVDVHKYKERLNATVGPNGWSAYLRLEPIGGKLVCTVGLTVLGVTKENVGDEVEVPELNDRGNEKIIGGPATNAYAQAFKRACSDFGLGAYLYDKEAREAATGGSSPAPRAQSSRPRPATQKQMEYLEKLMKSSVFSESERDSVGKRVAAGDAATVSKAIEWAKEQVAERKPVGV
jgi:hypothetical protein